VGDLLPQAPGWAAIDDDAKLEGHFSFKNFGMSLDFVSQVGELAETEFHHPLLVKFGWGFATIVLQTKKIKGLHENDFIMAAKINEIAAGMGTGE
jgi:4a-hydroxytetrahydrobiopterin dehydratase